LEYTRDGARNALASWPNVGEQAGKGDRAGDGTNDGRTTTAARKRDAYEEAGDGSKAEGDGGGQREVGECGRKWGCFCGTFSRGELPGTVFGPR